MAGECQDQADSQLRHADTVGARGVHDNDAARAGSGHVYVVDAGPGAGNHPQARGCGNELRGDLGGASDDERVAICKIAGQLIRRTARAGIDLPAFRPQQVQRRSRKVVSDNNLQWHKYNLRRR